jgi:S-adenosyl methyltransferase
MTRTEKGTQMTADEAPPADGGTGIPTAGNTHQVAQEIAPESRVVYVDYDPIVLAHACALLISHEAGATDYVDADLRDTDAILAQASELLDFGEPVAVTLIAMLHAIPESDDPHGIVGRLMDAVPPGVVRIEDWRPEPGAGAGTSVLWGAVGRKR